MESFYKYLENSCVELRYIKLSNEIKEEYQFLDKNISDELKWEYIAVRFILEDGRTDPFYTNTQINAEGETELISVPSHDDLDIESYKYYQSRLDKVSNKFLRIRYLQILFNSRLKFRHRNQAEQIIDLSLEILDIDKRIDTSDFVGVRIDLLRN